MKNFLKTICIATMLIVSSCFLIACNEDKIDTTVITGTWQADNVSAPFTKLQFNERGVGDYELIYYTKEQSEPQLASYAKDNTEDTYIIIISTGEHTGISYNAKLRDGKLVLTSKDEPTEYLYTKIYNK